MSVLCGWPASTGRTRTRGRLEICYADGDVDMDDGWGAVCDDYWTDLEADVACRQLGYAGSVGNGGRFLGSHFGAPGRNLPIWLDNVNCRGDENEPPRLPA